MRIIACHAIQYFGDGAIALNVPKARFIHWEFQIHEHNSEITREMGNGNSQRCDSVTCMCSIERRKYAWNGDMRYDSRQNGSINRGTTWNRISPTSTVYQRGTGRDLQTPRGSTEDYIHAEFDRSTVLHFYERSMAEILGGSEQCASCLGMEVA